MLQLEELTKAMTRPEGYLRTTLDSTLLVDLEAQCIPLLALPCGSHVFVLEIDECKRLHFFYSSPGAGSRVATVDLREISVHERLYVEIAWSPSATKLCVGSLPGSLVIGHGVPTDKAFRVTSNGVIVQVGDEGLASLGAIMSVGNQTVLRPPAIELWKGVVHTTNVLRATEPKDYLEQVVQTNTVISALVTGFETYSRARFVEVETEGIEPAVGSLVDRIFSKNERESGLPKALAGLAQREGKTLLSKLAERQIDFQNYEQCKRAYNKAYGIRFGDMGIPSDSLEYLRRLILHRHRVAHVSPLSPIIVGLTGSGTSGEEEYIAKGTVQQAVACFTEFIEALHASTLALRPLSASL